MKKALTRYQAQVVMGWLWQFGMNEGKAELLDSIQRGVGDFKEDLLMLAADSGTQEEHHELKQALRKCTKKKLLSLARAAYR